MPILLNTEGYGLEVNGRVFENSRLGVQMQYSKLVSILDSLIRRFVPSSADKPDRIPWSVNPPRALSREKNRLWSV